MSDNWLLLINLFTFSFRSYSIQIAMLFLSSFDNWTNELTHNNNCVKFKIIWYHMKFCNPLARTDTSLTLKFNTEQLKLKLYSTKTWPWLNVKIRRGLHISSNQDCWKNIIEVLFIAGKTEIFKNLTLTGNDWTQ